MACLFRSALLAWILGGSQAFAQAGAPPIELGLGISSVRNHNQGDFGIPLQPAGPDLRITIPFSPRFALEAGASGGARNDLRARRVIGYYAIQVKQTIVSGARRGIHPFVTYGGVGGFEHDRFRGYDYRKPDGSLGHFPGLSSNDFSLPLLAAVGGGLQQQLGAHAAVRADAQLITFLWIPLGARFTASLSVPLRRYDR